MHLSLSEACLEPFDEHYKDQCNGGRWRQFYFYDREVTFDIYFLEESLAKARLCRAFWFDGCKGDSQNIFTNYDTCRSVCEEHEFLDCEINASCSLEYFRERERQTRKYSSEHERD